MQIDEPKPKRTARNPSGIDRASGEITFDGAAPVNATLTVDAFLASPLAQSAQRVPGPESLDTFIARVHIDGLEFFATLVFEGELLSIVILAQVEPRTPAFGVVVNASDEEARDNAHRIWLARQLQNMSADLNGEFSFPWGIVRLDCDPAETPSSISIHYTSASFDPPALREGEIASDLPASFDAGVYFIGHVRTPWRRREDCPENGREATAVCIVELDNRSASALSGVETCSHLILLYWMDRARRDLIMQPSPHYNETRGTFALRSPVRPNPIGLSVVKLLKIEGTKLAVVGLDCLDNTPLIDIKPYFPSTDAVTDATVAGPSMPHAIRLLD